jgi:hypothetical protein
MELKKLSTSQLLSLRVEIEKEMQDRGLSFSVGEVGEKLAIEHFNSTPGLSNLINAPIGAKNVDALSRNGDRYSIKSIQRGKKTGTIYPDKEESDKQLFEYLLIVILSPDFTLKALYRFSWKQFLELRAWDKRMNAWYIPISIKRLNYVECLYNYIGVE